MKLSDKQRRFYELQLEDCSPSDAVRIVARQERLGSMGQSDFWQKLDRAADELDRLTSALPKTADGVTIVPGMEVFCLLGDGAIRRAIITCVEKDVACAEDAEASYLLAIDQYYSTQSAAEEAAK